MATKVERAQTTPAEETAVISMESAVSAAVIASGIGSVMLGLATIGAEANDSIKTALTWNVGVGPLSGKTGVAVIAFVVSWVILHFVFRDRPIRLVRGFTIGIILVALGLLMTFPPVFLLFEAQ